MKLIRLLVLFSAVCWLAAFSALQAQSPAALVAQADDHYFNLEYDEAIRGYYAAMDAGRPSADIWNRIATAILYQELNRLGMLETSAFRGDNQFLAQEKPKPDPAVKERFLGALNEARRLADVRLKSDKKDVQSLFALSQNYALEANYLFMVDKSYIAALRAGNKARNHSDRLREQDAEFVDAYLVAGVQEYVVGSLPWAVRALVALGGIHGNKEKGRGWVERVAADGKLLQTEARVLLTLLYRRESRPLDAAKVLEGLIQQFPRNYVFRLEMASMFLDAGEKERGLSILLTADRMARSGENSYDRMPPRLRNALERKIKSVREELQQQKTGQAAQRAVYPGRVRAVASLRETLTSTDLNSPLNSWFAG